MKTILPFVAAVLLGILGTVAGPGAKAGECGYAYCWGAIGIGPGGAYGYAFGQISEQDAYDVAMNGCGWDCTIMRTFYNACGAMAQASNGGWGWAYAPTRTAAEDLALGYCAQNGPNCRLRVWTCSR